MIANFQKQFLTPEEYLDWEAEQQIRHEYIDGEVYAMAGGTINHHRIARNILNTLTNQLKKRPCEVFGSDVKIRIDKANVFRYPDVSGLCGPIVHHDSEKDAYCNPALIVEVLSPSTEALDRGEKFNLYRLLDSFVEYLLVRQDRMEVELVSRESVHQWTSTIYNEAADVVTLRTLGCSLTLEDIYEKVEFGE